MPRMPSSPASSLRPATTYAAVVGRCLAAIRTDAGLAQMDLADAVGIDPSAWSRVESGTTAATVEQLALAGRRLGLRPGDVLMRADHAADELKRHGIHVEPRRALATIAKGWALVAAGAVAAIVGGIALARRGRR
jgi:transcriptional regulator with XRE-family HTH domain